MAMSRADAKLIADELAKLARPSGGAGGGTAGGGGTDGLTPQQAAEYEAIMNRIEGTQERLVELSENQQELDKNRIERQKQSLALKKSNQRRQRRRSTGSRT